MNGNAYNNQNHDVVVNNSLVNDTIKMMWQSGNSGAKLSLSFYDSLDEHRSAISRLSGCIQNRTGMIIKFFGQLKIILPFSKICEETIKLGFDPLITTGLTKS